MGEPEVVELPRNGGSSGKVVHVRVKAGGMLSVGKLILTYQAEGKEEVEKFKSPVMGRVVEIFVTSGQEISPGTRIFSYKGGCTHPTIMKDMCAECGADLRKLEVNSSSMTANVAMVHSIPELKVSSTEAASIGLEDQERLVKSRKLVLLVDLDQTLIHTTNDNIPPNIKDVYHFQLYGHRSPWYHTRIRPGTEKFLAAIASMYELHICTFGARMYAHTIAAYLDPAGKYFSHRILSRDECFDPRSKTANMSALFPCGDNLVCIIDDREDVWNFAPNLIHVKPYHFFKHTGDINAPPGLAKKENDDKEGIDFNELSKSNKGKQPAKKENAKRDDDLSSSSEDDLQQNDKPKEKEDTPSADMPKISASTSSGDSETPADKKEEKAVSNGKNKEETKSSPDVETKPTDNVGADLALTDSEDEEGAEGSGDSKPNSDNEQEAGEKEKADPKKDMSTEKKKADKDSASTDDVLDVEDTDDYLLYLEDILKTIHKAYYDLHDQMSEPKTVPDLKTVIPYVKRKVLQGVRLVFSGVVPTQVPLQRSKPYLLAKALGAVVMDKVDENTTHLVAARLGTAKVNAAQKFKTISVVTPDWLWSCSERWTRVDERLYPLGKDTSVTRRPPAHCSSPEIAFAERCADIDLNLDGNPGMSRQLSVADPFLAFSQEDLLGMDKEVEDILTGDDSSDEDEPGGKGREGSDADGGSTSSEAESLSGGSPRGHKRRPDPDSDPENEDSNLEAPLLKFKRGQELPSDYEVDDGSDDEDVGPEDWSLMGAELERELGN